MPRSLQWGRDPKDHGKAYPIRTGPHRTSAECTRGTGPIWTTPVPQAKHLTPAAAAVPCLDVAGIAMRQCAAAEQSRIAGNSGVTGVKARRDRTVYAIKLGGRERVLACLNSCREIVL
jgi:hypothetical protein